ncbi:MAG: carbohydrate porin [Glaciecola sp.]
MRYRLLLMVSLLLSVQLLSAKTQVSGQLINDASQVLQGGVSEGFSRRTFANLGLEYSFSENTSVYAGAQLLRGDNGSDDVGDIQAYSNIDEAEFNRIYEVWLQHHFSDIGLRIKLGQVDANNEFAFVLHSTEFLNSSMGVSPTIAELPTYPLPRMSLNLHWQTDNRNTVSTGIYSDQSNEFADLFNIGQWTHEFDKATLMLGAWYKSGGVVPAYALLDSIDNLPTTSAEGYYAGAWGDFPYLLFGAARAGWFSQIAYSSPSISSVSKHLGAGVQWYDTHGETGNIAGVGLSHIVTSNRLHNTLAKNETALEIFYRWQLNKHIALKPDLQYIIGPAAKPAADNAWIVTLRTEFTF